MTVICAALRLFVVQHLGQHLFLVVGGAGGQAEAAVDRAHPLLQGLGSSIMGSMPSATHSPWNRPMVRRPLMPLTASMPWPMVWPKFRRLAHGPARSHPAPRSLLEAQAAVDDVADVVVDVAFFKDGEQLRVGHQTCLDGLGQAVDEVAAGQGGQGVRVHDDQLGLPESAHDVLGVAQIHGGLAADGGIDHGKGGGGAVDKINAAHIDGSGKPGQIAHHAAAHGHHQVAAAHAELQHLPQHGFQNFKLLLASPCGTVMMVAFLGTGRPPSGRTGQAHRCR